MATRESVRQHVGTALVALQFALIAALAVPSVPAFLGGRVDTGAWSLVIGGTMLGLWALYSNRPGNFNIRPTPRAGGKLVDRGPYRWIRHPMYSAVIACGLACAWAGATAWGWLGVAALAGVLACKAAMEERWMLMEHPDYDAYRARTWRFLPGIL